MAIFPLILLWSFNVIKGWKNVDNVDFGPLREADLATPILGDLAQPLAICSSRAKLQVSSRNIAGCVLDHLNDAEKKLQAILWRIVGNRNVRKKKMRLISQKHFRFWNRREYQISNRNNKRVYVELGKGIWTCLVLESARCRIPGLEMSRKLCGFCRCVQYGVERPGRLLPYGVVRTSWVDPTLPECCPRRLLSSGASDSYFNGGFFQNTNESVFDLTFSCCWWSQYTQCSKSGQISLSEFLWP